MAAFLFCLMLLRDTLGLTSPEIQFGPSGKSNPLVLITVAESGGTDALILMLLVLRRNIQLNVTVIVFENGLSAENKTEIFTHISECEFRPFSKDQMRSGVH